MNNISIKELTEYQKKAICNGCGANNVFLNPPDWIFTDSCDQHDLDYWIGCTEQDRIEADNIFYKSMLEAAKIKSNFITYGYYKFIAWIYYNCVRKFASKYFYYGASKRTLSDL